MLNNVNLSLACAAYRATCKASSTLVACRTNFKAFYISFIIDVASHKPIASTNPMVQF